MAHPIRGRSRDKILVGLIEADVEIGFGLLDDAKLYKASGQSEMILRVLQDAADIVADIQRRLQQLSDSESVVFHPLLAELRNEIAALESAQP